MLITRRIEFSASHRCHLPDRSPEENLRIFGESAHGYGHGHNYVLEVGVEGQPDPVTGMIVDLKDVKQVLTEEVVDVMDHRHLNYEVPPFDRVVPTAENLAIEIWNRLEPRLKSNRGRLALVRLYETADLYVEYRGPSA
jgi:6-pyruvoyltetrahydropterin/6-carboxytetrahydropterin synthase